MMTSATAYAVAMVASSVPGHGIIAIGRLHILWLVTPCGLPLFSLLEYGLVAPGQLTDHPRQHPTE